MFKKSPKTKQFNLFSSPSGLIRLVLSYDLEMGLQMATKWFKDRIAHLWGYI